jgi:hypothetical protein
LIQSAYTAAAIAVKVVSQTALTDNGAINIYTGGTIIEAWNTLGIVVSKSCILTDLTCNATSIVQKVVSCTRQT